MPGDSLLTDQLGVKFLLSWMNSVSSLFYPNFWLYLFKKLFHFHSSFKIYIFWFLIIIFWLYYCYLKKKHTRLPNFILFFLLFFFFDFFWNFLIKVHLYKKYYDKNLFGKKTPKTQAASNKFPMQKGSLEFIFFCLMKRRIFFTRTRT